MCLEIIQLLLSSISCPNPLVSMIYVGNSGIDQIDVPMTNSHGPPSKNSFFVFDLVLLMVTYDKKLLLLTVIHIIVFTSYML